MITFDVLTLKAWIKEQEDFLTGSRISKIQQPTRREFIFALRNNGETRQFYVNINPQFYHCCFVTKQTYADRLLEIPTKPPMFCMLLRKYLESSRIARVNQPENERILEFFIETYNEVGDVIELCLAFEFMVKYSNVILYNTDTDIILGCAHNVGTEKSREREIYGSLPYVYPPKQLKNNIYNYCGEFDYKTASDDFYMISKSFANLCQNCTTNEVKNYLKLENLTPAISRDYKTYSLYSTLLPKLNETLASVNEMIDKYYSHYIAKEKFSVLKTKYSSIVSQKLKKANKALKQIEYKMLTDSKADKYRLYGDLLMANLYNLKDYSNSVNVYDYENNKYIDIELDKLKTIKDNANNFYKLYNKAKTAKAKLTELYEDYHCKKVYLEQLLYSINFAESIEDLFEISDELEENKPDKSKNKKSQISEIKRFEPDEQTTIYVGKNNKQNDYIISKIANENDLWFHVKDNAGSHVLLKTNTVTDDLILRCAKLAKEYSSVKNSSKIGIIYTKRKYIRKPPAANLGYVTYKNEKEIILD